MTTENGAGAGTDNARFLERDAIERLTRYMDILQKFERPLVMMMRAKYNESELLEADGKKCVISVTGLKFHELTLYFQISGMSIKQVKPYEGGDTFIQAPIWVVNSFLSRVLSGEGTAFADLVSGGDVKFRGNRSYHDLKVFNDVCDHLAENIKRLREARL